MFFKSRLKFKSTKSHIDRNLLIKITDSFLALALLSAVTFIFPTSIANAAVDNSYKTGTSTSERVCLNGTYVQAGINYNGKFGQASGACPTVSGVTWRPSGGRNNIGFVADRDRDGSWLETDFFYPGTPLEGWSIRYDGTQQDFDNVSNGTGASFSFSDVEVSASTMSVTHTTLIGDLKIDQTYTVGIGSGTFTNDQRLGISVTITNQGSSAIGSLHYSRTVDPDNLKDAGLGYQTTNKIVAQYGVSGSSYSLVRATKADTRQTPPGTSYIGLISTDSRSKVSTGGFGFDTNFVDMFTDGMPGDTFQSAVGDEVTNDESIQLLMTLGALGVGSSKTFEFAYVLSETAASDTAGVDVSNTTPAESAKPVYPSSLVTFAQNGADNNSFPQSEVLGETKNLWRNVLTREGYTFTGWNTKADGSGTSYADQASFKFDTPYITLYAQWKLITSKPTLTWLTPAAVNEGTVLSSTQLNATASVSGTFTYSPPSGTVLKRGNQVLKVTFVPNEAKYETVETTVVLQVLALPLSLVPATQVVSGVTGLAITPTSGISGVNFTSAPITYSVVGGSLPAGLTLNSSTGAISGTPTVSVNGLVITIQAQNLAGESSTATITFNIAAAPQVEWVTKQIDSPTVGKEYSFQLVANNANVYSIMSGNLPQGLTLDSATGLITGKATKAGKFTIQILANNMYNTGQALQFEISVVTAANQTSGNQNINMKPESAGVIAFAFKSFNLDSKNRAVVKQLNLSKAKVITIYGYASNNRTSDDIRISLDRAITVRKELQRLYPKLKINNLGLGTKQIAACKTVLNRCAIVVVNR